LLGRFTPHMFQRKDNVQYLLPPMTIELNL
jgi:hypothetical protein